MYHRLFLVEINKSNLTQYLWTLLVGERSLEGWQLQTFSMEIFVVGGCQFLLTSMTISS